MISKLESGLHEARDEWARMASKLKEKTVLLELLTCENHELKKQLEATSLRAKKLEAENQIFVNSWMLKKMNEEPLNEANSLHEDMLGHTGEKHNTQLPARQQAGGAIHRGEEGLERCVEPSTTLPMACKKSFQAHQTGGATRQGQEVSDRCIEPSTMLPVARQKSFPGNQADGVIRPGEGSESWVEPSTTLPMARQKSFPAHQAGGAIHRGEEGSEHCIEPSTTLPMACQKSFPAHRGSCSALLFHGDSDQLITGGHDGYVKLWDPSTGSLLRTLHGSLGSVLDLCSTPDGKSIVAATSANSLHVWDAGSGRAMHNLTGHTDKVLAVDSSRASNRYIASASHDRTIKVWDLHKGFCVRTVPFHSHCNALCLSLDGQTICSGHMDGNVRVWDFQTGKLVSDVPAHSSAITSLTVSRAGNVILSSSRDGVHCLFDIRSLEMCGALRGDGNKVASSCSRSCLSPDDRYVASGSSDGLVQLWSVSAAKVVQALKGHGSPVLCCSWSGLLASSDKDGNVCLWT